MFFFFLVCLKELSLNNGRGSGKPLGEDQRELVWQAALKMKRATGKLNWSELAKQTGFYRITIKAIVEGQQARPASATVAEVAELGFALKEPTQPTVAIASDTQPAPDIYQAFLAFAKQHGLPIQASTQVAAALEPPRIERPKAPAFFTPKKFTKIAFISDVHLPFENKPAVQVMFDFLADHKPDLILLAGDIYDFYEISDFDKGPGRITTLQDEFDEGRYFIKAIDELCPNVDFLLGNHEDREQRLINKNPGLFKLRSLEIQRAAELPDHWRIHPSQTHFKLGKLTALHGDIKGIKSAVHPARTLFQKLKRSCIFGHFHRFGNHLDTNYDGEIRGGFANGHLSDVSRVTSWVTCPDWQEGLSTISLCEDGGFAVQQRLIVNGRLITEGKEYAL